MFSSVIIIRFHEKFTREASQKTRLESVGVTGADKTGIIEKDYLIWLLK